MTDRKLHVQDVPCHRVPRLVPGHADTADTVASDWTGEGNGAAIRRRHKPGSSTTIGWSDRQRVVATYAEHAAGRDCQKRSGLCPRRVEEQQSHGQRRSHECLAHFATLRRTAKKGADAYDLAIALPWNQTKVRYRANRRKLIFVIVVRAQGWNVQWSDRPRTRRRLGDFFSAARR